MAQVIRGKPGIGAAFGTGLAGGLNALADAKIKQMIDAPRQQNLANILSKISGTNQQTSSSSVQPEINQQQPTSEINESDLNALLSQLPPQDQQMVLNAYQQGQQRKYQQEKLGLQREAHSQNVIGKDLKASREKSQISKKNIDIYNNLIQLANKGDIRSGAGYQLLSKLGLQNFGANVDTQVAQSLINELAQGAGSAFNTSRLTNLDVNLYKGSLVSLWNTPDGIKAIARNKILEEEANIARYKALRDEIKDNGVSLLTADQAEERAEPELRRLAEEAQKNIAGAIGQSGKKKSSIEGAEEGERTPFQQKADALERGILRTGARVGESLLGLPGDLASLGLGAANYLSGGAIPNYEQIQEKLPVSLPTTQQNREFLRKHTGEYLEPQSKLEEFADEVASDLSTLLLPVKGKIPFKAALGRALGANAASFFTKELGGGPLAQAGAKIGVSLLAGLPGMRGKLETTMGQAYDNARKSSGRGTADTTKLSTRARKIYDAANKGDSPNKDFIKERARAVERIADTGKSSIADVVTLKQDLNRQVRENAQNLSKGDKKIIGSLLDEVHTILDKYGNKNKTFGENFRQAEDIYRGLNTRSLITDVLERNLKPSKINNPIAKSILYTAGAFYSPATALKIAGGALASREIAKTFDLFKNSKEAQKYYKEFLEQALKNHGPAAARAAVKFDEAATDYFQS